MTKYSKESLDKLLLLIDEICNEGENLWFKESVQNNYAMISQSSYKNDESINKIYEYCVKEIITKQANKFYEDFRLNEIRTKLVEDFIRMEHFRRDDNFEDFCLAMFQQLEGIINFLITDEVRDYVGNNKHIATHKVSDKITKNYKENALWQLIFFPELNSIDLEKKMSKSIQEWDFAERFKTILFYYYFNKKIYNYRDFQSVFFLGNELYQSRNLNHRGGKTSESQKKIILKVKSESHKYYFKFLGFLEDFTSKINKSFIEVEKLTK